MRLNRRCQPNAIWFYVLPKYINVWYIHVCNANVMQCNVMLCYVMLCYSMSCYVMLYMICICMYMYVYVCDICPCCIHHHRIMRVYSDTFDSQKWCLLITVDTSHGRFDQPWPKWQPGSAFLQLMLLQPKKKQSVGICWDLKRLFFGWLCDRPKARDWLEGRLGDWSKSLARHASKSPGKWWFVRKNPIRSQNKRGFLQ